MTPLANYTIPGFYHKGRTQVPGSYSSWTSGSVTAQEISWKEFSTNVSKAALRVYLETAVRFKTLGLIRGKKHKLLVQRDIKVSTLLEDFDVELHWLQLNGGQLYKDLLVLTYFFSFFVLLTTLCSFSTLFTRVAI